LHICRQIPLQGFGAGSGEVGGLPWPLQQRSSTVNLPTRYGYGRPLWRRCVIQHLGALWGGL